MSKRNKQSIINMNFSCNWTFLWCCFLPRLIMILKIHLSKKNLNNFKEWRFLNIFWNVIQWNLIRRKSVFLKSRFSCLRPCNFIYTRWFYIGPYATPLTCAKDSFYPFSRKRWAKIKLCVYICNPITTHLLWFSLTWCIYSIKSLTINHKVDPRYLHGAGVDSARVLASILVPDMSDVQIPVIYPRVFDWYSSIVNKPPLVFTYQYFLGVHPHHLSIDRKRMEY